MHNNRSFFLAILPIWECEFYMRVCFLRNTKRHMDKVGTVVHMSDWYNLPIKLDQLNLRITLQCGQCFRWKMLTKNNEALWVSVVGNLAVSLKEDTVRDCILFQHSLNAETDQVRDKMAVSEVLIDLLQLRYDLNDLYKQWGSETKNPGQELRSSFKSISCSMTGLRLLRQDPWECFISFLCSQNNNIPRITQMIHNLCKSFGTPIGYLEGDEEAVINLFTFPNLDQMKPVTEKQLQDLGYGYRAKYVVEAVKTISSKEEGINWLKNLRGKPRHEVQAQLCTFKGVGQKVADCVALFSLDKLDMG
eukprot:TRINITY_DN5736_c0_g1_i5.p1 TRINITY_DN5736_c0_g1~~TRINITY_DN5736_c0_g1_i5.p1  ORF type:complete len:305 (+),score=21.60 TRINITY_DN5736_c0_g1_i5:231-1145(+)